MHSKILCAAVLACGCGSSGTTESKAAPEAKAAPVPASAEKPAGGADAGAPAGEGTCADLARLDSPPIRFDQLPGSGKPASEEEAAAALAALPAKRNARRREVAHSEWDGERMILVARSCKNDGERAPCTGHVAIALRDGSRLRIAASVDLPETGSRKKNEGIVIDAAHVGDLVGDADRELWVAYHVAGPQEPALGGTSYGHVAVYAPSDLRLLWHRQVEMVPDAGPTLGCVSELHAIDAAVGGAACDGARDLVLDQRCGPYQCLESGASPDPDCKEYEKSFPPSHERKAWLWSPSDKGLVEAKR